MATVVFDLDGTLADTSGDLIAAANAALEEMGHPPQLDSRRDAAIAVRGGRRMLAASFARLGLPERDHEAAIDAGYPILLRAYDAEIDRFTYLYPGALEAVERLRAAGYFTGICTNKPKGLAEKLMTRLGVRDRFDALVGADTLPVRKPDPEPLFETLRQAGDAHGRSILIGDSDTDRATATNARIPSVLVSFGPAGEAVADLAPEAMIGHFDELFDVVTRLVGPPDN